MSPIEQIYAQLKHSRGKRVSITKKKRENGDEDDEQFLPYLPIPM